MAAFHQIATSHFGRKAVVALARKGIFITGLQAVPTGRFADYDTGYVVNDNGTGRIWLRAEVMEAAR